MLCHKVALNSTGGLSLCKCLLVTGAMVLKDLSIYFAGVCRLYKNMVVYLHKGLVMLLKWMQSCCTFLSGLLLEGAGAILQVLLMTCHLEIFSSVLGALTW